MNETQILEYIKLLKQKSGKTFDDIASDTGIQKSNLSNTFNGKKIPSIATLNRILKSLDAHIFIYSHNETIEEIINRLKEIEK